MIEIGEALARAREAKGLSLEQIAEQTRIGLQYLRDLEQGNFSFLPRPYVVAYIKTVARIVGLDGEALVRQWREREEAIAAAQKAETETAQEPGEGRAHTQPAAPPAGQTGTSLTTLLELPYLKEILIGFGILVGMAILLYLSARSPKRVSTQPPAKVQEIPFEQVMQETADQPPAPQESVVVAQPMRLEIQAADAAWVQVITDQRDTSEYSLRTGNARTWQAQDQFAVRLGNAGAVKVLIDGKDVGEIGQPGQVASLIIGRDGIKEKRLRGRERRAAVPPQPDTIRQN